MSIGGLSMQEFIDEDPERPEICFGAIDVVDESLRGHVDWRTDVDVLEVIP